MLHLTYTELSAPTADHADSVLYPGEGVNELTKRARIREREIGELEAKLNALASLPTTVEQVIEVERELESNPIEVPEPLRNPWKERDQLRDDLDGISSLFPDSAPHKHPETGVSLHDDVADLLRDKQIEYERAEKHWREGNELRAKLTDAEARERRAVKWLRWAELSALQNTNKDTSSNSETT